MIAWLRASSCAVEMALQFGVEVVLPKMSSRRSSRSVR